MNIPQQLFLGLKTRFDWHITESKQIRFLQILSMYRKLCQKPDFFWNPQAGELSKTFMMGFVNQKEMGKASLPWIVCFVMFFSPTAIAEKRQAAPEFPTGLPWLNVSRPLTMDDLRGRAVILDFWTYGCINCLHVADELHELEERFGEDLLVIGIHSPKFENEENTKSLRRMLVRLDRRHPVVSDRKHKLMSIYGAKAWPTLVLIDPEGYLTGYVTGEGVVDLLGSHVKRLLKERDDDVFKPQLPLVPEKDIFKNKLLAAPAKISADSDHVAVSDSLKHQILLTDKTGKIKKVIGTGKSGLLDGDYKTAQFSAPQGVLLHGDQLFVADAGNHVIRRIDLENETVNTIAGSGEIGRQNQGDSNALKANLRSPWDLALYNDYLYIAMAGSHQIWKLDVNSKSIKPWAGYGGEGIDDGPLKKSTFSQPSGLSLAAGKLYVADAEASAIREIDLEKASVRTIVGTGLFDFGDQGGKFGDVLLQHASGIAVSTDNKVYIADTYNHKVKLLDLAKKTVATIKLRGKVSEKKSNKASGKTRSESDLHPDEPGDVELDGERLFIADTNNGRILSYDLKSGITSEWKLRY